MSVLLTDAATAGTTAGTWGGMLIWVVILLGFLYFFMIRPQQKDARKKETMMSELAVGDTVLTTSGFYGIVIDIAEDTVIVEFGSNRNCRIPMQKAAISAVEKPEDSIKAAEDAGEGAKAGKKGKKKENKKEDKKEETV